MTGTIGIFDSGVGGLSVLQAVEALCKHTLRIELSVYSNKKPGKCLAFWR
ncbi:MAG: Glutamate racemase [Chlamydiae bacterium]|nr:Glutamate racemase [Chlamydiota bacterium]